MEECFQQKNNCIKSEKLLRELSPNSITNSNSNKENDIKNLFFHKNFSEEIYKGNFKDPYTFLFEEEKENYNEEYLLFIIHGIGQNREKLERILNLRIAETVKKIYSKKNFFKKKMHIRMIDWKSGLEQEMDSKLNLLLDDNNSTLYPKKFIQQVPTDVLYYLNIENKYKILNDIILQMNNYHQMVKKFRPKFLGGVSVWSHSLGSVISYEIFKNLTFEPQNHFTTSDLNFDSHIQNLNFFDEKDLVVENPENNLENFNKENKNLNINNEKDDKNELNEIKNTISDRSRKSPKKNKRHFCNLEILMKNNIEVKELLDGYCSIIEDCNESEKLKKLKIDRNKRKSFRELKNGQNILKENFDIFSAKIHLDKNKKDKESLKKYFSENYQSELYQTNNLYKKRVIYSRDKNMDSLNFIVDHLFFCGSPLSLFLTIQNSQDNFIENMETVKDFHNIIHPMDPLCYRIEPIIKDFPRSPHSFNLPDWENDSTKNGMCVNFLNAFFNNRKTTDEKPNLFDDKIHRKRFDFICKEKYSEKVFNIVGFLFSHMAYWDNFDILYFMIKLIHFQEYEILVN